MSRLLRHIANIAASIFSTIGTADAAEQPREIRLDYAHYAPLSLVLQRSGWLEQEFKADNFPINSLYIRSRPERTTLVVPKDSPIKSVRDLKGRKVTATKGTGPYLFLLRSLHQEGMKKTDIEHASLQHADGRTAPEQGKVDTWAGLDPLTAASEIDAGSKPICRSISFNTYGFLDTTEWFSWRYPEHVKRVIAAYEKAREWIVTNPEETAKIVAEEAKLSLLVAKPQLTRIGFSSPVHGSEHIKVLKSAAPILIEEERVRKETDGNKVLDDLVDPSWAKAVESRGERG
ncbi:ABC transporter substrate-binding protein [Accumulibacter sp.]|uniref:ABC transporter substrate-binding protein n=1 Tax=Accumulibacter sp. TaxID=2053492 RepID=UPI002633F701|nr:ABC transporter substrate-binding protein [Accumulibacter sp.]